MKMSLFALEGVGSRGSYLDVGTGRGEMLTHALNMGFSSATGTEVIAELLSDDIIEAAAHDLPFDDAFFDVVSCLDVLEHLLPEDTEAALTELARVAKHDLILSAANYHSKSMGVELHVNRRPYEEWDTLIQSICGGNVTWLPRQDGCLSEYWHVEF